MPMPRFAWWWQPDSEVLEQIKLYRELRERETRERREARREQRDYVAVAIALLAALFTFWQAFEARQARKDTQVQFERAQQQADIDSKEARETSRRGLEEQTKLADRRRAGKEERRRSD